jgi:hypothetical protein
MLSLPIHTVVKIVRKLKRLLREPDESDTTPENPLKLE